MIERLIQPGPHIDNFRSDIGYIITDVESSSIYSSDWEWLWDILNCVYPYDWQDEEEEDA